MTNSAKNSIISPVIEQGQSTLFHVGGANFKLTGSHIELVESKNDTYNTLVAATKLFNISEAGVSFNYDFKNKSYITKVEEGSTDNFDLINDLTKKSEFLQESAKKLRLSGNTGAALAQVNSELESVNESLFAAQSKATTITFTYLAEENIFKAGSIELLLPKGESLAEMCFTAGYISFTDKKILEAFQLAAENLNTFTILDTITEAKTEDKTIYVMRAEGNAYIYKISEATKLASFEKMLVDAAIEYVAEETGNDVSSMFEDLLEAANNRAALRQERIDLLREMLSFLQDQKARLAEADTNLPDIKAANNLIRTEIAKITEELNSLEETKLDKNAGYIDATLKVESEGLSVGTEIKVDAVEFTQAGKSDILTVFVNDNPHRIEKFKINIDSNDTV